MVNLLKAFGKGLLYFIGMPFFVLALAIFGVIGLFAFIFQVLKSIVFFFTGQKFFPELPEDKKLRLLREGASQNAQSNEPEESAPIFSPIEDNIESEYDQPIIAPSSSIEETVFNKPVEEEKEEIIPEEEKKEIFFDDEEEEEEHTVLETEQVEKEESVDEELETYVPRSSTYTSADEVDENDTNNGVNIDYDL